MQKNGNILIITFLILMLFFCIYSVGLYSKLEKEKAKVTAEEIKTLRLKDSLQQQLNANLALQVKYDSLLRVIWDSISRNDVKAVNPSYPEVLLDIKTLQQTSARLNNLPGYTKALQLEREGFSALIDNHFDIALAKFTGAEKLAPSINMSYEISRFLRRKKNSFDVPEIQNQIKQEIVKKYSWGAPPDLINKLKSQVRRQE